MPLTSAHRKRRSPFWAVVTGENRGLAGGRSRCKVRMVALQGSRQAECNIGVRLPADAGFAVPIRSREAGHRRAPCRAVVGLTGD